MRIPMLFADRLSMHIPKIIAHGMKKIEIAKAYIYPRDLVKISVAARSNYPPPPASALLRSRDLKVLA